MEQISMFVKYLVELQLTGALAIGTIIIFVAVFLASFLYIVDNRSK